MLKGYHSVINITIAHNEKFVLEYLLVDITMSNFVAIGSGVSVLQVFKIQNFTLGGFSH